MDDNSKFILPSTENQQTPRKNGVKYIPELPVQIFFCAKTHFVNFNFDFVIYSLHFKFNFILCKFFIQPGRGDILFCEWENLFDFAIVEKNLLFMLKFA